VARYLLLELKDIPLYFFPGDVFPFFHPDYASGHNRFAPTLSYIFQIIVSLSALLSAFLTAFAPQTIPLFITFRLTPALVAGGWWLVASG